MTIRAKFVVQSITLTQGWGENPVIHTVHLAPVLVSQSPENAEIFVGAAHGAIDLSLVAHAVGKDFDIGQAFYVDFTPAGNERLT
ncbi:MAG: hypothetical protein ACJ72N_07610 [Labedaea sp.]|jgi:hypothetical protein